MQSFRHRENAHQIDLLVDGLLVGRYLLEEDGYLDIKGIPDGNSGHRELKFLEAEEIGPFSGRIRRIDQNSHFILTGPRTDANSNHDLSRPGCVEIKIQKVIRVPLSCWKRWKVPPFSESGHFIGARDYLIQNRHVVGYAYPRSTLRQHSAHSTHHPLAESAKKYVSASLRRSTSLLRMTLTDPRNA